MDSWCADIRPFSLLLSPLSKTFCPKWCPAKDSYTAGGHCKATVNWLPQFCQVWNILQLDAQIIICLHSYAVLWVHNYGVIVHCFRNCPYPREKGVRKLDLKKLDVNSFKSNKWCLTGNLWDSSVTHSTCTLTWNHSSNTCQVLKNYFPSLNARIMREGNTGVVMLHDVEKL